MIIKEHFLKKIKDMGLNSYEAKLWTALLSRGVSTAGELSDIANVPRSRSYDVLESLEKKGFIVMKIGKPIKYLAVPPEEVIERVKQRIKKDADVQVNMLNDLKDHDVLEELSSLFNQGIDKVEPDKMSCSIRGRNNIHNHLNFMVKNAKNSVVLVSSTKGILRKHKALKRSLQKAKDRGVSIKIGYVGDHSAEEIKKVNTLMSEFGDVKKIKDLHSRFCIVDNHETMFMLMDDEEVHPNYDTGVWIGAPYFAQSMSSLFKKHW